MKNIKLTRGLFALVDDEDYDFLNQWKWLAHGHSGIMYARRRVKNDDGTINYVSMHNVIMNISPVMGELLVDHKDRNSLNNQKNNLRKCTYSQNTANSKKRKGSNSKYRGVVKYEKKNKWRAVAHKNGKQFHIGYFESEAEAATAYNKKAIELHGEFANLNKIK